MKQKDGLFKVQVWLSLLVAGFCMASIGAGRNEAAFWSTLSAIIGYWLPQPRPKEEGK